MHAGDKLLVVCAAAKRKPRYREAFMEEFAVAPPRGYVAEVCALWVEAFLADLSREWGKRGRASW